MPNSLFGIQLALLMLLRGKSTGRGTLSTILVLALRSAAHGNNSQRGSTCGQSLNDQRWTENLQLPWRMPPFPGSISKHGNSSTCSIAPQTQITQLCMHPSASPRTVQLKLPVKRALCWHNTLIAGRRREWGKKKKETTKWPPSKRSLWTLTSLRNGILSNLDEGC